MQVTYPLYCHVILYLILLNVTFSLVIENVKKKKSRTVSSSTNQHWRMFYICFGTYFFGGLEKEQSSYISVSNQLSVFRLLLNVVLFSGVVYISIIWYMLSPQLTLKDDAGNINYYSFAFLKCTCVELNYVVFCYVSSSFLTFSTTTQLELVFQVASAPFSCHLSSFFRGYLYYQKKKKHYGMLF